jgi:hypothetical protein
MFAKAAFQAAAKSASKTKRICSELYHIFQGIDNLRAQALYYTRVNQLHNLIQSDGGIGPDEVRQPSACCGANSHSGLSAGR